MTYEKNQPEDLPPPNIGVQSVRENFLQYFNAFNSNHSALNTSNQGKHSNVILQQQGNDPSVEVGFDTLYGKSVITTSSTSQELFARIPQFLSLDKPNIPEQLTFNTINIAGPQYQSFLAGGYIIYFGKVSTLTINVPLTAVVTLSPVPSKIVCVIPNPTRLALYTGTLPGLSPQKVNVILSTVNTAEFTIFAVAPGPGLYVGDINWLAIAKQ